MSDFQKGNRVHRILNPCDGLQARLELRKAEQSGARQVLMSQEIWQGFSWPSLGRFEWLVEVPWDRRHLTHIKSPPSRIVLVIQGHEISLRETGDLQKWPPQRFDILVRPDRRVNFRRLLDLLPSLIERPIYFEFLPWSQSRPERMTVGEVRSFLALAARHRPDLRIQPFPGLEVTDDRIDPSLDLEPIVDPVIETRPSGGSPLISVIIPSFNNRPFLTNVMRHLIRQEFSRTDYEIIVVDDGSTDGTEDAMRRFFVDQSNFAYISLPRPRARERGDDQFRAGIARNVGAAHARGSHLLFLDSDIIVGSTFLSRMARALNDGDVVQCERHHIPAELSNENTDYDKIRIGPETYIENPSYRRPFYRTDDWHLLPYFWKYTCTYCLMVSKADFYSVGRFKRCFTTYGFEDVDLGYELAKRGKKFKLLHEKVLHLTPTQEKSEYRHSALIRDRLLSKTAKTFFLQHLDPEIYDHFEVYMRESGWSRNALRIQRGLRHFLEAVQLS